MKQYLAKLATATMHTMAAELCNPTVRWITLVLIATAVHSRVGRVGY